MSWDNTTSVFFAMLGLGIVAPILPLFAEHFKVSYSLVGMVVSVFGVARLFTDLPAGSVTDVWGRKPLILAGLVILGAGALVAAFAGNIYHLISARFVMGVGSALFATTAMALLGDIAPAIQRGRYMSYYQGSFFLGTAIGPSVGGFLATWGLQAPFLALALLSLVAAIFVQINVTETLERKGRSKSSLPEFRYLLREAFGNVEAWVIGFTAVVLFILNVGVSMTAIPLYGEHVARITPAEIGAILSFAALSGTITLAWSGRMIDKVGAKPLLVTGFVMAAASIYAFILSADFLVMSAAAVLFGIATGMISPAQAIAVIKGADPKHTGFAVGVYRIFCDIGIILGPVIVGALSDFRGLYSPFRVVSLLCLLTGVIAYAVLDRR